MQKKMLFRTIEIDIDPDTGSKFVKDILEGTVKSLCNVFKYSDGYHFFAEKHVENTDFGRAKKFPSQLKKVMEQL